MLYLLGILKTPTLSALDVDTKELIHQVVLLSEEYNQDPITALAIMNCESGLTFAKHTNDNGTKDYGFWQINDTHRSEAKVEGLNIENPKDNLEYGMELLAREGTSPWSASRQCWLGASRAG